MSQFHEDYLRPIKEFFSGAAIGKAVGNMSNSPYSFDWNIPTITAGFATRMSERLRESDERIKKLITKNYMKEIIIFITEDDVKTIEQIVKEHGASCGYFVRYDRYPTGLNQARITVLNEQSAFNFGMLYMKAKLKILL